MDATTDKYEGARANANGWYETIKELIERLNNAETDNERESVQQEIQEGPLSVLVRDGWRQPGSQSDDGAEEFEILLSTGGPALRIWGTLDKYSQPDECELQMQDWGVPWGRWTPEPYDPEYRDTLRAYASNFYFGE